jgi:hypothetical protein
MSMSHVWTCFFETTKILRIFIFQLKSIKVLSLDLEALNHLNTYTVQENDIAGIVELLRQ